MRIFISYAHVDEYRVRELVDILRDSSHDPWFDHRLRVGRTWEDQLLDAIGICECFLYALTPESVESKWCQWEFAQAVHAGKAIVPVLFQDETPLPGVLGRIQYADFSKGPAPRSVARLLGGISDAEVIDPAEVPLLPPPHTRPERPIEGERINVSLAALLFDDAYAAFRDRDFDDALELLHDCLLIDAHHAEAQKLLVVVEWRLSHVEERIPEFPPSVIEVAEARVLEVLPEPFEWIAIPAGQVELEDDLGWFDVPAFEIAKYPITNAQFQVFVDAQNGYSDELWWDYSLEAHAWHNENKSPRGTAFAGYDLPRTRVTWYEAVAFCRWLSSQTGEDVHLPTEQQWQRAAQGDDGRTYPWGEARPDEHLCNWNNHVGQPTPVMRYPEGASPYGVMDMSGNVWEWCVTDFESGENDISRDSVRVLRGGSFSNGTSPLRATERYNRVPDIGYIYFGFRIARLHDS